MSNIKLYNIEKKVWFYDLEQFPNLHTATFKERDSDQVRVFVIHPLRNELEAYLAFLINEVKGLIGFNNLNYDYPLIHYILTSVRLMTDKFDNPDHINSLLYLKSGEIISQSYSSIAHWNVLIPQLDLFRVHHFDNVAKRTSLKNIQFVIKWNNVEDLDIAFNSYIDTNEEIEKVIKYNLNDVLSTEKFYYLSVEDLELRKKIKQQFNIECLNFNDTKIGSELFLRLIAQKSNRDVKEIRELRTERDYIKLNDIILPYINFKTGVFKKILKDFKNTTVNTGIQTPFDLEKNIKGIKYKYGVGGLHACISSGIYSQDDEYYIEDIDVGGYYPALAVVNNFYPEHLGQIFCDVYSERYNYRLSLKNKKNKTQEDKIDISVWKLALNGTYGKSGDIYSYLYDPKFMFSITVNGQLLISMLVERLLLRLDNPQLLQINTDGLTLRLKKSDSGLLREICKKWENLTGLTLEFSNYKKMIIRDVNNYMAIYDKLENELEPQFIESEWYDNFYTKHKVKGVFQIVPEQNGKIAYNKIWSQRIVPKAIYNYYAYNIPIIKTIKESKNIYDFCKVYRAKDDFIPHYYKANGEFDKQLTKTTRYYLSIDGGSLYKYNKDDGRRISVEAKERVTIFNKFIEKPFHDYKINYLYYIKECNKIINKIESKGQIKMFN